MLHFLFLLCIERLTHAAHVIREVHRPLYQPVHLLVLAYAFFRLDVLFDSLFLFWLFSCRVPLFLNDLHCVLAVKFVVSVFLRRSALATILILLFFIVLAKADLVLRVFLYTFQSLRVTLRIPVYNTLVELVESPAACLLLSFLPRLDLSWTPQLWKFYRVFLRWLGTFPCSLLWAFFRRQARHTRGMVYFGREIWLFTFFSLDSIELA